MQEIKYQGNYITVTEENIDGHIYERVRLRGGVHIIPYREEDQKILLIHEDRIHERGTRWKLVSGWIDKEGKTALMHAQEELSEEVGFSAEKWEEIFYEPRNDLTFSANVHFFICEDLKKNIFKRENPDSGEVIAYDWFSLEEILFLIQQGKILRDFSIYRALEFLYRKKSA